MTARTSSSKPSSSSWKADSSTDPLNIAVVYDSFKDPTKCGCVLVLDRLVRRLLAFNDCPVCQTPIQYVQDDNKKDCPTVVFKYGKQIYRLSVPPKTGGSWFGGGNEYDGTAQQRIASVLGMQVNGMKILSKGKVLHPSSTLSPQQVSQQVLDLSQQNTVSLLVMGTIKGQELHDEPPWWMGLLQMTQSLLVQAIDWVQQLLRQAYNKVRPMLTSGRPNNDQSQ